MPGNIRTFKLDHGGYADVPEENVDAWLGRMQERGIHVEVPEISADMQVGDPEVIKTPQQHGASGNWGPDQDMGFMDRFASGLKGYAQDFGKAGEGLVRGLNQSLYQGGADEVAAGARAAGGENFGSALKDEQAQRDQAWNDTPLTYGAGRALGYVPGMLLGGGGTAAKTGWEAVKAAGGRVAANSAVAGLNGFLSNDGSVEDRLGSAAQDAAVAAPFGIAGEAMTAAGPAIDKAGVAMRRANAGGTAGELNAIRQNQGLEHMQSGIDQDFQDLGLASSLLPQSAYGVAKKLGTPESPGIVQAGGQQMGSAIDDATAAGVHGSWDSVRGSMDNSVRGELGNMPPTVSQQGYAGEMRRIASDELPQPGQIQMNRFDPEAAPPPPPQAPPLGQIPQGAPSELSDPRVMQMINAQRVRLDEPFTPPSADAVPQGNLGAPVRQMARPTMQPGEDWLAPVRNAADEASPRDLQTMKNRFESEAYPKQGTVRPESDAPRAAAYRDAASANRAELHDAMSGTDFYPDFNAGRETVEKATPLAAMAGARAAANKAGSRLTNPLTWGPAAAGAGLGAASGGVPGAIAGAAIGGVANHVARNYGQDMAGMGARALGQGMGGAGQMMQAGGRLAGGMSSIGGANEPQMPPPPMPPGPMGDSSAAVGGGTSGGVPFNSRGYAKPDVARQMLQQNPMAFGKYTQQFNQAMQSGDPGELVKLLDRLETTDPEFDQQYGEMLLQQTAGTGGAR